MPSPWRCSPCPNPDCDRFNQFDAGNLSVAERMGRDKAIRRLYCNCCHKRFSERQGPLMQHAKLPEETVVRIVKCLGHGCSVEATADICEVDPRTVQRMLERSGRRAEGFHDLQLQRLRERQQHEPPVEPIEPIEPIGAVELDELHGRACEAPPKKGSPLRRREASRLGRGVLDGTGTGTAAAAVAAAVWVETGFTRRWRAGRGS